jgi:hypothetical protein
MKTLVAAALTVAFTLVASPIVAKPKRLVVRIDRCSATCTFPLCLVGHGVRRPDIQLCSDPTVADVTVTLQPSIVPQGRSLVPRRLEPAFSLLGARVLLVCLAPDDCDI